MTSTLAAELVRLGVVLPLAPCPDLPGVIRDAEGRDIVTVDVNGERPDSQVEALTFWLAAGLNLAGALPVNGQANDRDGGTGHG